MTDNNNGNKPAHESKASKSQVAGILRKLLEFQKLGITVEKDGTNPHFKSTYATLNEVLDKVKKPLNDLGVLILQVPTEQGLKTQLFDIEDGTFVDAFMPYVEVSTAQKLGSNNTYNRRYSLVTILGLEDEDDDGNVASAPARKPVPIAKPVQVATKAPVAPSAEAGDELDDLLS